MTNRAWSVNIVVGQIRHQLRGGDGKGLAADVYLQPPENLFPKIHRVLQYLTQELI
jgi:hypothetical protein